MSGLFEELSWRGLVHQFTDPALPELLDSGGLTVYIGFDPTADSLHIGHLFQMCNLRRLQQAGHRPIALAGGGTGMIGDPSGRTEERSLLSREQLQTNLAGIRKQLETLLDFDAGALLVDNGDWLWSVGLLEFLRDVGKYFTVNQMVAKESVRARLEEREHGISYTEFTYMLLQAYDFLQLFEKHDCVLQMGASDQWGNIVMGVDLIRRLRGEAAYGLTTPLVLRADGTKFGKSDTGLNVWLDPARTSPYEMFQFFVRCADSVVGQYLRFYTWLPRERIEELDAAVARHPERREAQRALALEVTALVHGREEAERADEAARALFESGRAAGDAPSTTRPLATLRGDGLSLVDVLVDVDLVGSKSAARRDVTGGGVYVNGRRQEDVDRRLTESDLTDEGTIVLRRGKKHYHVLRFV